MAKSITTGKRENEKKRIAKREEKLKKKEYKKSSGRDTFDDMIAYVDANGMLTSTPPSGDVKKEEINVDEIIISTPKRVDEEPTVLRGCIDFFNEGRGFGFIKELSGVNKYFFHVNNVIGQIVENNIVTFDLEHGPRGVNAINVCLEKVKPALAPAPAPEPAAELTVEPESTEV